MTGKPKKTTPEGEQVAVAAVLTQLASDLSAGSPDKATAAIAGLLTGLSLAVRDIGTANWVKRCSDAITKGETGVRKETIDEYLKMLRRVRRGLK